MPDLTQFDSYLSPDGPAALVIREHLMPVEGTDGVLFPATFAAGDGFPGGYNIDTDANGNNVALIDSVGSQANRIEPIFKEEKYRHLVPQIVAKAGAEEVNMLDAGHRAGDAIFRCTSLKPEIETAFRSSIKGDAEPLAKLAPTSLVFGVWNSRGEQGTQDKRPRVIASTIRAFNVRRLTRHAQYVPPLDYSALDVFSEEDKEKAEGDPKSPLAKRGFVHVPVTKVENTHGGVIADGGVRRDATLSLVALRLLHVGKNEAKTLALRRYILGLSLVAFTHPPSGFLRQSCLLVLNPDQPREFVEVFPDGKRPPCAITHETALTFASASATAFGVGDSKLVPFEKEKAKADVKKEGEKSKGKKGGKGKPVEDGGNVE